ncbi:dachshund-like protein 2 [Platysternon megacephalum]|uniref:Dachshund-like protein 2 n=1 Tax=Platysternon megacephalum TaxID=55544 RepID=A0A4D9ETV9_9SAUR|nr:dachshund-like protein 2 [Platysternon megacephalum]
MHSVKNIIQSFLVIFWMESGMSVMDNPAACLQSYTLTAQLTEIMGCMKGERGNKLMHHNTQLMEALKPPHKYMPEIVRDGKDMDALQG